MRLGHSITIASGASQSEAVDVGPTTLMGVALPAAWTTANLTFLVSATGIDGTYQMLQDANGIEVTAVAAASVFVALDPALFAGVRFVKVRSGTNGSPVTQGADRTLNLSGRRFE